jgi:hypothetical protein
MCCPGRRDPTVIPDITFEVEVTLEFNSLTAIRVLAGTKNSRPVGRKPQHNNPTNMTTMVVPFAPHTAWDLWIRPIGRA